jgi:hypothetical protein
MYENVVGRYRDEADTIALSWVLSIPVPGTY